MIVDFDYLSECGPESMTPISEEAEENYLTTEYNPISDEQICCIELVNNNKIYIRYKDDWTVKDLIRAVINHKEFRKLYPKREWLINSEKHLDLFDLHLIIYRSLKPETETKIDINISLKNLYELGLVKNHKYPFFVFKDNRNQGNKIAKEFKGEKRAEICQTIIDNNFEYFTIYQSYLPRVNTLLLLRTYPELEEYFRSSKRGVNMLTKFQINPLISENSNLDWFIYDDESLNFLMEVEKIEFSVAETVRCSSTNENRVYFQDKYPYIVLSNKEYKFFFIVLSLDKISMKVESSLTTSAFDLLKKINAKIEKIQEELCFDPKKKILKVESLNDYIIDLEEPVGKFAYINECIRSNRIPEYNVIDNPFIIEEEALSRGSSSYDSSRPEVVSNTQEVKEVTPVEVFKKISARQFTLILDENPTEENQNEDKDKDNNTYMKYMQKSPADNVTLIAGGDNITRLFSIASFQPQEKQFIPRVSHTIKGRKLSGMNPFQSKCAKKKDILEEFMTTLSTALNNKIVYIMEETIQRPEIPLIPLENEDSSIEQAEIKARPRGIGIKILPSSQQFHISTNMVIKSEMPKIFEKHEYFLKSRSDDSIFQAKNNLKKNSKIINYNIFKELANSQLPLENYIEEINDSIRLQDLDRPFSITLRNIELDKLYNSVYDDPYNKFYTVMIFTVQLFYGSEPFSSPRQIKWTTSCHDRNPILNKRIYFDVNYSALMMFSSLIFQVKHLKFNSYQELVRSETIGWVNFRLFDHNRKLKTDDAYFCFVDNHQEKNPISISFELETFMYPVVRKKTDQAVESFNPYSHMISDTDHPRILQILEKTSYNKLTSEEKELLWANRYQLTQIPSIIPMLLSCIDYKNSFHLEELEKILKLAKPLSPVQALQLLSGKFLHESIRAFAVECLAQASHIEVREYLIQLVHVLKFEMYHNSHLARFLLKLAIRYPLTIGHYLFWSMRSEMYNPNVQQRFGLYLEVFFSKIGKNISAIFADELWLIKSLHEISQIPHSDKYKTSEEKLIKFKESLEILNECMEKNNKEISMPLNFKLRVKKLITDQCKIMKSKKKPLWLAFENADPQGKQVMVIYKTGDDLRMDILTLQLFKVMQSLWFEEKINLKMSLYAVICTGYFQGMIEIVKESETLATIHKMHGGATASLTDKPLGKWLQKFCICSEKEYVGNFLVTSVAYCVATFVLGVGDRHNDNIMIKKNGELFHIDFGHFLGHFKYKYGIKRERAPFVFTKEFRKVLGGKNGESYLQFRKLCAESYQVIRKNAEVLITLLRMMLCTGITELNEESIKSSLCLNSNEKQAEAYLKEKLEESLYAISTRINFALHVLANK